MRWHVVGPLGGVAKERVAIGDEAGEERSRSDRTLGSAFSQTISEALVWWTKTEQRPRPTPELWTTWATWSVISLVDRPLELMTKLSEWNMRASSIKAFLGIEADS